MLLTLATAWPRCSCRMQRTLARGQHAVAQRACGQRWRCAGSTAMHAPAVSSGHAVHPHWCRASAGRRSPCGHAGRALGSARGSQVPLVPAPLASPTVEPMRARALPVPWTRALCELRSHQWSALCTRRVCVRTLRVHTGTLPPGSAYARAEGQALARATLREDQAQDAKHRLRPLGPVRALYSAVYYVHSTCTYVCTYSVQCYALTQCCMHYVHTAPACTLRVLQCAALCEDTLH